VEIFNRLSTSYSPPIFEGQGWPRNYIGVIFMIALIIAGGSGTRFWPLSTEALPKQFLRLIDDRSMIQLTYDRIKHFVKSEDIYVITTKNQSNLVAEHLREIPVENILTEPFGMNTAPCIGYASYILSERYSLSEITLVIPADHYIPDVSAFHKAINSGCEAVLDNRLLLYGIIPTYPATGYGYIEKGDSYNSDMFHVKQFKEKPDIDTALEMLSKRNFLWNSGMFCWKLSTVLESFNKYCPLVIEISHKLVQTNRDEEIHKLYSQMPRLPIDIAIMEQADNVVVLPVNYAWSDVGSWLSISQLKQTDEKGNYIQGKGFVQDSTNNAVFSEKSVALLGVSDLIIVESENGLLVMHKDSAEKVKNIKICD
jgi:mannose-1-phosphate guanylyltransferase